MSDPPIPEEAPKSDSSSSDDKRPNYSYRIFDFSEEPRFFLKAFELQKFDGGGNRCEDPGPSVQYLNGRVSNLSDAHLLNITRRWFHGISEDEDETERLPTDVVFSQGECADDLRLAAEDFIDDEDADKLLKATALRYGRFEEELR